MKTLTIRPPWGGLVIEDIKDVENRKWKTNFRGRFLVHTSSQPDIRHRDMSQLFTKEQWCCIEENSMVYQMTHGLWLKSAIIGSVEIVDCVQNHHSIWAEKGVYNWVLKDPIKFNEPILNVKGKLSFWEYDLKEV